MSALQITKPLNKQIDATQKEFVQLYDKLKDQSFVERLDPKPLVRLFGAYKNRSGRFTLEYPVKELIKFLQHIEAKDKDAIVKMNSNFDNVYILTSEFHSVFPAFEEVYDKLINLLNQKLKVLNDLSNESTNEKLLTAISDVKDVDDSVKSYIASLIQETNENVVDKEREAVMKNIENVHKKFTYLKSKS